jgi:hypothetical protein
MSKSGNHPPPWFWGSTKKCTTYFGGKSEETVATDFEVKSVKTVVTGFEDKPEKIIPIVLMSNHWQTVSMILWPNLWQTVDLGFEAQPRNSCSSSPRARYRLHTTSPDLLIVRPPSTRHVRPSRSSTPGLLLLPRPLSLPAMLHLPPTHNETSKCDSPKKTKVKGKTTKMSQVRIQTSSSQWLIVNKPRNWSLDFSNHNLVARVTIIG